MKKEGRSHQARETQALIMLLALGERDCAAGRTELASDVLADLAAIDSCPICAPSSSMAGAICNRCSNGGC